jgi:ABC-2 type transport system permease protein
MVGAVYDRGYRGYEGTRGGQRAARGALFRASVRRALGIRRPWRQKVAPLVLLAIATVPAIVFVGVGYVTRDTVASDFEWITYREYVGVSSYLLVFVALTAPDIMCPDRRQRVLPVLFARPLTGADYVIAKIAAMFAIVFAFAFLPQVVLFVGQMLVSDDGALRYARDNAEVLWQVPVAVSVLAMYYAAIGVAISSLTSRRIIAGASIIGLLLISGIVSTVLVEGAESSSDQSSVSVDTGPPETIITEEGDVIVVPSGEEDVFGDDLEEIDRDPSAAGLFNLLTLPLVVRDLVFLGEVEDGHALSGIANGGLYALLVYVGVLIVSFVILFRRYDEVER